MGLIRKALFIATLGISGRVFKEKPKAVRVAKAPQKSPRPRKQTKRPARRSPSRAARTTAGARSATGTSGELERLAALHASGALSDAEFAAAKAKILGTSRAPAAAEKVAAAFPAVEANVAAARHLSDLARNDGATPVAMPAASDGLSSSP
jgi:hypothetical protein